MDRNLLSMPCNVTPVECGAAALADVERKSLVTLILEAPPASSSAAWTVTRPRILHFDNAKRWKTRPSLVFRLKIRLPRHPTERVHSRTKAPPHR